MTKWGCNNLQSLILKFNRIMRLPGSVLLCDWVMLDLFYRSFIMGNQDLRFTCQQCGADKLAYQKYAKCITPVSLRKDGHIEYGQSTIDEDDSLATLNGFACRCCGTIIEHCGCPVGNRETVD